jgi:hypothetical protein
LYGAFAGGGIWKWDGATWSQITPNNPQFMAATGSVLYGDFAGSGIWKYEAGTWTQLTPTDPLVMVAGF